MVSDLVTTREKYEESNSCNNRRSCARSCCYGKRGKKLCNAAIREFQRKQNNQRARHLQVTGNVNNLNNPDARGQGGAAAHGGQKEAIFARIIEIMLCIVHPEKMISTCRNIPRANDADVPRTFTGVPNTVYGQLKGVYEGMKLALEIAAELVTALRNGEGLPDELPNSPSQIVGITRKMCFRMIQDEIVNQSSCLVENGGILQLYVQLFSFWRKYFPEEMFIDFENDAIDNGRQNLLQQFTNVNQLFNHYHNLKLATGDNEKNLYFCDWHNADSLDYLREHSNEEPAPAATPVAVVSVGANAPPNNGLIHTVTVNSPAPGNSNINMNEVVDLITSSQNVQQQNAQEENVQQPNAQQQNVQQQNAQQPN